MANAAITIDLNAKIANFETELKRATGSLDRFEKKGNQVAAGFKTAFAGLGAALSVGAIASFAKSNIDAADALNDMSKRLTVSVKDLASFQLAAEQSGTSLDGIGKGIARLTRSIGEAEGGNKKLAATLSTLGITARDPKEAFFQLADAVQRIQDPSQRAALLNQVLGKSYGELVPLLSEGGDALRESARQSESFADAMARLAPNADKFNDEMSRLKQEGAGAAAVMIDRIAPGMAETAKRVRELLDDDKGIQALVRAFSGIGKLPFDLIFGDIKAASTAQERIKELKTELNGLQRDLQSAQPGGGKSSVMMRSIFGSPEEISQQITVIKNQIVALEKFGDKIYKPKAKPADGGGAEPINLPTLGGGGSKSDPLANLLGSTDIGKLAEFDKQVALLNTRFDGGRKSSELYSQAMTKLVETTFAANFSEFNKQLAEQDETQRLVAEHLKATNDELFEQQQAWIAAGKALDEEMRTPLENANIEFGRLQDLLDRGVIGWETYARAVMKVHDAIEETPKKLETMDTFAKQFAENAQNSFADFFKNFDKGTDGMLQKFGETIKGLIAEAVAADLSKRLFGDLVKGGEGSGIFVSLLSDIGEFFGFADGGIAAYGRPVALPRFAGGGISNSAAIFGEAGPEAAVPLPDGRRIPVEMRGGGGNTIIVNVSGSNNAPDVRRAAGQGAREGLAMIEGARRYG